MTTASAGLLMFRRTSGNLEVLLAHPGGPYWKSKDFGAWTIPKGRVNQGEDPLAAAQREFQEETGWIAEPPFLPLGTIKQKSGKIVHAWAFEGDANVSQLRSNTCEIEWPPRSGSRITVPEVDRASFFTVEEARERILAAQLPMLDALVLIVKSR